MIENIDRWIGVMLNKLELSGQLANTLVVVSSDHGEMLGDRGIWGKSVPFQPSVEVPLVIAGPGVSAGTVISTPTTILDLAATFADFSGAAVIPELGQPFFTTSIGGSGRSSAAVTCLLRAAAMEIGV